MHLEIKQISPKTNIVECECKQESANNEKAKNKAKSKAKNSVREKKVIEYDF